MAYQLPWDRPHIRTLIDTFKCRVMEVQRVVPVEEKRMVVWRDGTSGETHVESMTSRGYYDLCQQVLLYDVGVIVGSEWDS